MTWNHILGNTVLARRAGRSGRLPQGRGMGTSASVAPLRGGVVSKDLRPREGGADPERNINSAPQTGQAASAFGPLL